jgi:sulfur-oxidizing protein SoxY
MQLTRRNTFTVAGAGCASLFLMSWSQLRAEEAPEDLVARLMGKKPIESDRIHLVMPARFPNGYTVPLSLAVDSPMTKADHVRQMKVLAPYNPIVEVATFNLTPERSLARVSTRIRLAEPQFVLAVAEMNDGALLMAKSWVSVATNGCS